MADPNDKNSAPTDINGTGIESFDGAHELRVKGFSKNIGETPQLRKQADLPVQGRTPASDANHQDNNPASLGGDKGGK
jgi:hypothetical protein